MASARGDALDWALALARAPGERHALRQRPLPEGMDTVLQVAGGSQAAAIEEAAAHAGMSPAEVVEAARFYLREMLFFPEADAYRVLGLAADASDEQVKHHHRLLQQWLHPDRPTSDWDAAFAARVNAAWSQLRTPARREAHAARVAEAPASTASEPSWSPPARRTAVAMAAGEGASGLDEGRWRRRAPVLALFGVCVVLGVLAVRDMQREPESAMAGTVVAEATPSPPVALQLPAVEQRVVASKAAVTSRSKQAIAKPTTVAVAPKPALKPIAATAVTKPAVEPRVAQTLVPSKTAATPVIASPARKPAAAVVMAPKPTVGAPPAAPRQAAPTAAVAAIPQKPVAPRVAAVVANKPAAVAPPLPKPTQQPATVVATVASASTPVAAAVPAPAVDASSPQQVMQAQQTGQRLLAFVAGRGGGMPPIWANLTAQTQASRAREALQGNGRVDVGQPDWRVGGSNAAMHAKLTPMEGDPRRLRVDLVWREQRWLVTGLALEQAP